MNAGHQSPADTQAKLTDAELIASAEAQIELLKSGTRFDKKIVRSCAAKFRTISTKGEGLKASLPALMKAIDEAILKFYPHVGVWDHGHRSELLNRYIAILDKVAKDDPVAVSDLNDVLSFCSAIRTGFEKFQNGRSHGRS